ncbi:OLC1v1035992C1 [Oldenlandia corymbosa var. corymbosa]|uniref:OLC1v1035992C1 n=1 Tax=Oldenlandia corymbosa var. corymbosa TaxID=529605 RepID=A0AAV1CXP8_OLDCO|nr:OLC1v1035992C1 [Oldenlandia corymbosa var. corymbosa]
MDDNSINPGDEDEVLPESPFEESLQENEVFERAAHHPSAPLHEVFDISTAVDPSFIISLIRKLLPTGQSSLSQRIQNDDLPGDGPSAETVEQFRVSPHIRADDVQLACGEHDIGYQNGNDEPIYMDDEQQHEQKNLTFPEMEAAWEEHGCTLWDLAASETHAELMVENLILEVIMANLKVSQSVRIIEISLGIMGNLACHDVSRKKMSATNGLIETVVDKLFLNDSRCLCEAFRLLTLSVQGGEAVIWAEALSSEHVLSRVLWVVENTLNVELIEKSIGFLTIVGSQQDVATVLVPQLMKLGLSGLLINQFILAMNKLTEKGIPERYSILDTVLQAIEALSSVNEFSSSICSDKELFKLLIDLIKIPDKVEVADSCVTAAVLVANILTDLELVASELSHDMEFLEGVFDTVPLASDDIEAKSALWSTLARILNCVEVKELNTSTLHQYLSIIVKYSDMIEEELLNFQLDEANEVSQSLTSNGEDLSARSRVLRGMFNVLRHWKSFKAQAMETASLEQELVNKGDVDKMLYICRQLI